MTQTLIDVNDLAAAIQSVSGLPGKAVGPSVGVKQDFYAHGMWGHCGPDDIISAYVDGAPFADWLNWKGELFERTFARILANVGPDMEDGVHTSGVLADECDTCESVKWGKCEIDTTKALLCRCGEEITTYNLNYGYCEEQPIFRVDGTPITNNAEWQAALAAQTLGMDIEQQLIYGNRVNANEADGLQRLVRTGYVDCRSSLACAQADSIVVDWQFDGMNGTCNGHGNIINKITDILRRFKLRAGARSLNTADVVIMLPSFMRDFLVDYWAAFGTFLVVGAIQVDATEVFRRRERFISGGANGDGWVPVNGQPISFLVNDYMPMDQCNQDCAAGGFVSDIYVLTRRMGNMEIIHGTYQNYADTIGPALASRFGADQFRVSDGGKFLRYQMLRNEICFNTCVSMRPGLHISAPFMQARIHDICATAQFAPISKTPGHYYFPDQVHSEPVTTDLECF